MKLTTRAYLAVSGLGLIGIVGVPLACYPQRWAAFVGWDPPESTLEEYFGRSLGAIGLALGVACCGAALGRRAPKSLVFAVAATSASAAIVHAMGRGRYPKTEDAEVAPLAVWAALGAIVWLRELG